jgi:hypothetical protein
MKNLSAHLALLDRALEAGLISEATWQLELQRAWAAAAKPTVAKASAVGRKSRLRLAA